MVRSVVQDPFTMRCVFDEGPPLFEKFLVFIIIIDIMFRTEQQITKVFSLKNIE